MKKFTRILLITLSNLVFSQSADSIEFRKVVGEIIELDGKAMTDAYVYIPGTDFGTYSDINGRFCYALPKDREIFLTIENMFEAIYIKVKPNKEHLILLYKRIRRKSNRVRELFLKKEKTKYGDDISIFYSQSFKDAQEKACGNRLYYDSPKTFHLN